VLIFLEGGIGASYSINQSMYKELKDNSGAIIQSPYTNRTHSRSFTALAGVGAEYYLTEQLSLFGRQDMEFQYGSGWNSKSTSLDFGTTTLGLTMYF